MSTDKSQIVVWKFTYEIYVASAALWRLTRYVLWTSTYTQVHGEVEPFGHDLDGWRDGGVVDINVIPDHL